MEIDQRRALGPVRWTIPGEEVEAVGRLDADLLHFADAGMVGVGHRGVGKVQQAPLDQEQDTNQRDVADEGVYDNPQQWRSHAARRTATIDLRP